MKIDYNVIDKILDKIVLYDDFYDRDTVYAEFPKPNNQKCLSSIDGKAFKSFLRLMYCELADTDEELPVAPVLRRFHDISLHMGENERIKVYHRLAGKLSTGIEYFLADRQQQAVKINADGCNISKDKEHQFIHREATLPQDAPIECEKNIFDLLAPYANLSGDSFKLFVIWLIQGFSSETHYILFLAAERGSGKSVLTSIISELLDPSPAPKCQLPSSQDDLQTLLANQYLCSFDNVREISKDQSDTFCIAVTGGTSPRRKKFCDSDMVYLPMRNVLVLNGIGIVPSEADLAERSLFFSLKKLTSAKLVSESKIMEAFAADKPYILHQIFDTLSKAMKIFPDLTPKDPPRMVDAYTEMLAIALALGITEADFGRMIAENTAVMDKARAVDPLVEAIAETMDRHGKRKLEGSPTEIFNKVNRAYSGKSSLLPATPSAFGKKLNQLDAPLKAAGFRILLDDTGAKQNNMIIIRAKPTPKK